MTRDELEEALAEFCPSFEIRKDRKGQLIVHTGLFEDAYGELNDGNVEEIDPEDLDEDEDFVPLEDEDDE